MPVLGFADVSAEIPYHYGILVPEVCQGLLQFRKLLQGGGQEVCTNDLGPLSVGDDLTDHLVYTMEARRLYVPSLWLVPDDHEHYTLHAVCNRCAHQWAHWIVYQPTTTISLVIVIGLCKYHQVKAVNLYRPYGLRDPGPLNVAGVDGHKG